ncbi:MAG: hypothetical protein PHC85_00860 [Candidatus Pacebacteria bacterium]|nr:hypothetical protein [Candidatus Paceibacterota bacterium]
MRKIILIAILLFAGFVVSAQNPLEISYPIAELGSCNSQEECKIYCDNPANQISCIEWGKSRGVFSAMEAKRMEDMAQMENKPEDPVAGPGGCTTPKSCDMYCRSLENLDECLNYGVQNGYTSAEEADKIREKAAKGGPGGCQSRENCDSYCKNRDNIEECMKFVVDEGKISQEEADFMIKIAKGDIGKPKGPEIDEQKAMEILEAAGSGPGGCKNPEECKAYCDDTSRMEECMNFAVEHGLMPREEAEKAQKMMSIGGPGGCKNTEECDAFCSKEENRETCFNFSKESGLLSPEEAIMMEKQMSIIGKMGEQPGPGGCRSIEECSNYCGDPARIEECANFAADTGMMSKDRVQGMMQQMDQAQRMQQFFMMQPQESMMPQEGMMPPMSPGEGGMMPQPQQGDIIYGPPGGESGQYPDFNGEQAQMMPRQEIQFPERGDMGMPPGDENYRTQEGGNYMPMDDSGQGVGYVPPSVNYQQLPPGEMRPPVEQMPAGEQYVPTVEVPHIEVEIVPPSVEPAPSAESLPTSYEAAPSVLGIILWPFIQIFGN